VKNVANLDPDLAEAVESEAMRPEEAAYSQWYREAYPDMFRPGVELEARYW
jgi:hypothetical protein